MTVSLIPHAPITLDGDDDLPGRSIIDQPGPTGLVHPGSMARYVAPGHARMLAIHGPNPEGQESSDFAFQRQDG